MDRRGGYGAAVRRAARLLAGWLFPGQSGRTPPWLRAVALSYPLLYAATDPPTGPPARPYDGLVPGCPVILTRVGRENPEWLAAVDDFLTAADGRVEQIDLPDGRHGFDALHDTDASRAAIIASFTFLHRHLTA